MAGSGLMKLVAPRDRVELGITPNSTFSAFSSVLASAMNTLVSRNTVTIDSTPQETP